jgi:2,3-dimethylmalate lyase
MKRSTLLRKLLADGQVPAVPAINCADQAQLCEKLGFQAVLVSGSSVSTQMLGLPDAGFLNMVELAQMVQYLCSASNIAAMVDCDTGFGNAIGLRRTVAAMIRAGAAGLFIEDQVSPKRCGFVKGKEVLPLNEAVGKYRAALDVRGEFDPDFIIMARTDARTAVGGSVAEVIRRGHAYLDAGVDVLYVSGLQSREEIREVRSALKDKLRLLSGSWSAIKPALTQQEMREFGICMAHFHLRTPYLIAMHDYLAGFKKRGFDFENEYNAQHADHPMGGANIFTGAFDLSGLPKVAEWEEKYLPREMLAKYEGSLGLYDPRERGEKK